MASETYEIHYRVDDTASAVINQIAAALRTMDAAAVQAGQAVRGVGDAAGATKGNLETASVGIGGMTTAMIGMRAAMVVFHEIQSVIKAIGDGFEQARKKSEELAEGNLKLRDSMRELANLQGHAGPDDEVVGNAILLGLASGLKPQEAQQFLSEFEGSIPAGRQKHHIGTGNDTAEDKKLEQEMAKEGAAFGARLGIEPGLAGDLAGVVSQYTKIGSAEDLAGQLGAMAYGLNEGRGRLKPLIKSELSAAGNLVGSGHMEDLAELGAFVGVGSTVVGAGRAGTNVKQMDALLNTAEGKGGSDYLASIGVNKVKGDYAKLGLLKADLDKNAKGDADSYLKSKGFGNKTEIAATVAMAENYDVLRQRTAKARTMTKEGASVMALDRSFLDETETGRNRKAEAALEAGKFLQGKPKEGLQVARKFAEARLKAYGEIDTPAMLAEQKAYDESPLGAADKAKGIPSARERQIDLEVKRGLLREGERVGVKPFGEQGLQGQVKTGEKRELKDIYNQMAPKIQERGGDPTGGLDGVKAGIDKLVRLEEQKIAQRNGMGPPPAQGPGKAAAVPGRP